MEAFRWIFLTHKCERSVDLKWWALLFFCSCTVMNYHSGDHIPVALSYRENHAHVVVVEGQRDFYLWGAYPREHVVLLDEELSGNRVISASNVMIEEYQSGKDWLMSIITFGMYFPLSYRITCLAKLEGEKLD